jgi:exodeoxyribonuclease V gamma subunit
VIAEELGTELGAAAEAVGVDVHLPDGRRLIGAVPVIGHTRRVVAYTRLSRKARLAAWVDLLGLTATHPDQPWRAVTLGRGRYGSKDADGGPCAASVSLIGPGPPRAIGKKGQVVDNPLGDADLAPEERRERAVRLLDRLVTLRDRGLCGPLLLPCETAGAYAETAWGAELGLHRKGPVPAARSAWTNASGFGRGEDQDHAHRLVLGSLPVEDLLAVPPEPEEDGDGWDTSEPSRLGRLGRHVWWPLLAAEEIEDR